MNTSRIHLIATGGTIAVGEQGLVAADGLVDLIPELQAFSGLTVEDFSTLPSSYITPEDQFRLAKRVTELLVDTTTPQGIVITHGTDTLEETAFFVDLLCAPQKPVVFTAAMRFTKKKDSDGPRNLIQALRLASSPLAKGLGVLVTLNGEIHSAVHVRKTHPTALHAFQSPAVGPIGFIDDEQIRILAQPPGERLHLPAAAIEPRVDLITLTAGNDGHLIRAAVESGAQGLVIEVFGRGNSPPAVLDAAKEAVSKGCVVVFTSRTRGGRVQLDQAVKKLGVLSGEAMDGIKARMLLIAALGSTRDPYVLQSYFERVSGV